MSDENKAVILLNSLLDSNNEIKMVIKYGSDSLTMNIVLNALRPRELELKKNKGKEPEKL